MIPSEKHLNDVSLPRSIVSPLEQADAALASKLGTSRKIQIRFKPIGPIIPIFLIAALAISSIPAAKAGTFQLVPNTNPTPVVINNKRYVIIKEDEGVSFKVAKPEGLISLKWSFTNASPTGQKSGEGPHQMTYDKEAGWGNENPVQIEVKRKVGDQNCNTPFKRVAAVVIPKLVTPAGDPVASPKNSGDGQNEFTFNTASPGELTINLKATIAGGIATNIVNDLKFEVDAVGTSTLEWDTANPDGKPTASGNTITAIVKFKNLPDSNSAFGKKKARLKFKGRLVAEADYEVFFPRDATNHPGSQTGSPNWLFYYTQLVPKLVVSSPDPIHGSQSQYDPNTNTIALDNGAIQPYNPHFGTNGELKGIDTFYWGYTHEMQHYKDWHDFWDVENQGITKWQNAHGQSGPNGNKDGDDFPNSFEDANGNGILDSERQWNFRFRRPIRLECCNNIN